MSTPTDLNEVLLQLYSQAHELEIHEFQDAALGLIKQLVPFDSSMWGTATATPAGIDIHTIHLHRSSQDMLDAYDLVKHLDPAPAELLTKRQSTKAFLARGLYNSNDRLPVREMCERFGHENMVITAKSDPVTKFVHWISLYRGGREAMVSDRDLALVDLLAPHVMQALGLNRLMHMKRLEAEPDTASEPTGSNAVWHRPGMAIADLRGVVYQADPRFQALMRTQWPGWEAGFVPQVLIDHFLQGGERFSGDKIVVLRRVEHGLLFMTARARCLADSLTARELHIARLIAHGETHKEIAQALNRSPATIRNHIQTIYGKLGVGNIAGLIKELRRLGPESA